MKNEPDSDIEIEFLGRNQGEKRIWDVDAEPDPVSLYYFCECPHA